MERLPDHAGLLALRGEVLGQVSGRTLELGAGLGSNLRHYPANVERVLLEPHAGRAAWLRGKGEAVVEGPAETLPFDDQRFDTVVETLVFCSVRDVAAALAEIHRVLVPGGRLLLLDHVAALDPVRRRWQDRLDPAWSRLTGCHLTRDPLPMLPSAGFVVEAERRGALRPAPFVFRELQLVRAIRA